MRSRGWGPARAARQSPAVPCQPPLQPPFPARGRPGGPRPRITLRGRALPARSGRAREEDPRRGTPGRAGPGPSARCPVGRIGSATRSGSCRDSSVSGGAGRRPRGPASLHCPGLGPTRGYLEGSRRRDGQAGLLSGRRDTPARPQVLPTCPTRDSRAPEVTLREAAVIAGLAPLGGITGGPSPACSRPPTGPRTSGRPRRDGVKEKHFACGKPAGYFKTSGVSGECSLAAEVGSNYCITRILSFQDKTWCKSLIFLLA